MTTEITREQIEKATKFFMENGGEIKLYDQQNSIPGYIINDVTSFGESVEDVLDRIEVELFAEYEREDFSKGLEEILENDMNMLND